MIPNKEYLGDSVYVEAEADGTLILTTENSSCSPPSNKIYLESYVIKALLDYIEKVKEAKK